MDFLNEWRDYTKSLLKEQDNDIDAAAGILLVSPEKKILLQLRSEEVNNPNTYGTPGGHLVEGESFLEGAKREFYEETSYKGPFGDMKKIGRQHFNKPYVSFIAKTEESDSKRFVPLDEFMHEVAGYKFFSLDEILELENIHPGLKMFLEDEKHLNRIKNYVDS